jgi:tRNA threonylcarbamoyl adenosine modification protein YeaZ
VFLLVVDTSTPAVTAAVAAVGGDLGEPVLVADQVTVDAQRHGELLAPSIEAVLGEAGIAPGDLAAVVAGVGPGPFTGLRIGLVSAAALADALGLPTYGVCSLDAIAYGIRRPAGQVLVATDARRREVYWATYGPGGERISGPSVSRPAAVPTDGCVLACGAGAAQYAESLGLPVSAPMYPPAAALAALAAGRVTGGAPAEVLSPLYLRRPDAAERPGAKPVPPVPVPPVPVPPMPDSR